MSSKNGLNKVMGWFVVREPEEGTPSAAPREAESEPKPAREAAPASSALPAAAPGEEGPGFAEVYRAAGIAEEEQDRAERALDLLRTLPAGVPVEARRAIVAASLAAFGIPLDRILTTAGAELRALDGHAAEGRQRVDAVHAGAQSRIEALEAEIAEIRKQMAEEDQRQEAVAAAAGAERARVTALFEFFGKAGQHS